MASDNSYETDIPTLDDLVVVEKPPKATPAAPSPETQAISSEKPRSAEAQTASSEINAQSPEAGTKPLPRNNPFLPYEHLEQLARERAEFQKQFIQFSFSKPATQTSATTRAASTSNQEERLLDQLAGQIAEQLVKDIRPLIEQRVREALENRLAIPSSKRP